MPELPEVETVRIGLKSLIIGHKISGVEYDWEKSFPNTKEDVGLYLNGANIINIRRRAKVLMIDLSSNYSLVIHLKMTGQLVYRGKEKFGAGHPNDSLVGKLPDKSTRVVLSFDNKSKLYFNDQRKFGWVRLMPTSEIKYLPFMQTVGPEPLSGIFTQSLFMERILKKPNTNIKAVLLDQKVLAGIGNIYADESLWGAQINPNTLVKYISSNSLKRLYKEILFVLKLAIEKGGSTDRNYVNAEGKKGTYMEFARVFRRENMPCPRCGTEILKIRVAGRGTHICPKCQKLKNQKIVKYNT